MLSDHIQLLIYNSGETDNMSVLFTGRDCFCDIFVRYCRLCLPQVLSHTDHIS